MAFDALERSIYRALEVYSNVHRGSGHFSMASTALYEGARDRVRDALGLDSRRFEVIFCTPWRARKLLSRLPENCTEMLSSQDVGLPLGLRAVAVERRALPKGAPFESGGGVVKLVGADSVVWEDTPERYEAGTPAIINVIAFARALQLQARSGRLPFVPVSQPATVGEILYNDGFGTLTGRELLTTLRRTHIGAAVDIPVDTGLRPYTNLDNGASTPTFAPIWEVVRRTWQQPESVWRDLIGEVRRICAGFLDAPQDTYDVIFMSNTTEALNFAAQALHLSEDGTEPVILNTLLEHHSNELPWRGREDYLLERLPVEREGFVALDTLEHVLHAYNQAGLHGNRRVRLVAVCGASNVLGTFNDWAAIAAVAHRYGAYLLVDAAQLIAHRQIRMAEAGVDVLVFSAHKAYAPFGSGALIARKGLLRPTPETLEAVLASGEENVAGIAALGKTLDLLGRIGLDVIEADERALIAYALERLLQVPGIQCYGVCDVTAPCFSDRGPVLAFHLKRVPHNLLARRLAERGGIGVRNGCFCAHLLVKRLLAIAPWREAAGELGLHILPGLTTRVLPGIVRASFGLENDASDVDTLVETLHAIAAEPRTPFDCVLSATHNGTPFGRRTETAQRMAHFVDAITASVFEPLGDPIFLNPGLCHSLDQRHSSRRKRTHS